jgi:ubiquinone/menaquinone biosynthesis C-methylase UbiE
MTQPDYTAVTEVTGYKVTREQLQRMYTRYRFASEYSYGKTVLEVACGSGQGLGYLAKTAQKVVGGDIDENNLAFARGYYAARPTIELRQLDAHQLPFAEASFDVVILYEAIYYLAHPEQFVSEAKRVLRASGTLIICLANKDLPDFNPSPHSCQYFSAHELTRLLREGGFKDVQLLGDCPATKQTGKDRAVSLIKRTAVALHLVPKTMKGKEILKRIFVGKLQSLPPEIDDSTAVYTEPVKIPADSVNREYKVLFATGCV